MSRLFFSLLGLFALAVSSAHAQLEPVIWTPGSHVVMQLGFGPASIVLQDGMSSWNASAADALDIWNGYVDDITASSVSLATVPQVSGDGVNAAFFSNTVFGDSFGDNVLAVTVLLSRADDSVHTGEADVVVNTAYHYNSYRGPLQTGTTDFHRVVLHEFGHVLGLAHSVNNASGEEIMDPVIGDLDHLARGDIIRIRDVYGAIIYNLPESTSLRIGDYYEASLKQSWVTNANLPFTIDGLPPGIAYDSTTNTISGTATAAGHFGAIVTAHGPFADAYAAIPFYVQGLDRVQGLQGILRVSTRSLLTDPTRTRIYAAAEDGVKMIDTDSLGITQLSASAGDGSVSPNLSISSDSSTLLFTDSSQQSPVVNRIDLESLQLLPALPIPANASPVLEGLDNRDYVAGQDGVYQFDRTTGSMQSVFADNAFDVYQIALSPDQGTLFVYEYTKDRELSLLTYDVSGPDPLPVLSLPGSFFDLLPSPDGNYLYYTSSEGGSGPSPVFRAPVTDLGNATQFGSTVSFNTLAASANGTFYSVPNLSSFSLYDPVTLKETYNIGVNHFVSDFGTYSEPDSAAFDSTGQHLFVRVGTITEQEVWAFSTDFAAYPVPVPDPAKNLLNLSTRLRVEDGDAAMIGGFVVVGNDPKKVLLRGIGPSLPLTGALSDPILELHDSTGKLIATNDNWITNRSAVVGTNVPPGSERESAIIATLKPGAYTAILRDATGQPGLGLVEIYDLDPDHSILGNISTRGNAGLGDDAIIGGFILGGADNTKVLIRALGPSLGAAGIQQPLPDPVLEIVDQYGSVIADNDNWRSSQQDEIIATGIPPPNDKESAIIANLYSGSYTAIVRGQNNTIGIALVEVYNLDSNGTVAR